MIENFGVLSSGKIFTHNPHFDVSEDIASIPELAGLKGIKGTVVVMRMPNNSKVDIRKMLLHVGAKCQGNQDEV